MPHILAVEIHDVSDVRKIPDRCRNIGRQGSAFFEGKDYRRRGVVFLGARYLDVHGYDPAIAHAVNDVTRSEHEPAYNGASWYPQVPFRVNVSLLDDFHYGTTRKLTEVRVN